MHAIRLDEEVFGRSLNLLWVYAPHTAEVGPRDFWCVVERQLRMRSPKAAGFQIEHY